MVESGDIDGLFDTICKLFEDEYSRLDLSANLAKMALPDAAASLTKLILSITR